MEEIRGLLSMVVAGSQTCGEVEAMGREHLATVRDKIKDLKAIENGAGCYRVMLHRRADG